MDFILEAYTIAVSNLECGDLATKKHKKHEKNRKPFVFFALFVAKRKL
jgi:hypothetical protein